MCYRQSLYKLKILSHRSVSVSIIVPDIEKKLLNVNYFTKTIYLIVGHDFQDLCARPGFIQDGPAPFDISPGKMGKEH